MHSAEDVEKEIFSRGAAALHDIFGLTISIDLNNGTGRCCSSTDHDICVRSQDCY